MDPSLVPYHQHHQELLRLARIYESRLDQAQVRNQPELCLAGAQRLVALAKALLAMEQAVLYPALLCGMDADVRATAQALEAGLEDLKTRLDPFGHRWTSTDTIRRAPEAFIEASQGLLQVLRRRIEVEVTRLFPLVERA
jgi:hypothetical protein